MIKFELDKQKIFIGLAFNFFMKTSLLIFIVLTVLTLVGFLVFFEEGISQSPPSVDKNYCGDLTDKALEFCKIFNEIDYRIGENKNWYLGVDNLEGAMAWTRSPILDSYVLMYEATKDTYYLDKLVLQIDDIISLRDDNILYEDYNGESLPGWSSKAYTTNGEGMRFVVHSGVITYPMVKFAKIVYSNPSLYKSYNSKADFYLQSVNEVVDAHESEWVTGPNEIAADDEGYYIFPEDSPVNNPGLYIPHNQQLAMARTLLVFPQNDRAEKIGKIFKGDLENYLENSYVWHYWWGEEGLDITNSKYEDTGHGGLDIRFALDAHENGLLFGENNLRKFSRTFTENIFKEYSKISFRVDGSFKEDGTGGNLKSAARWLGLSKYNNEVYEIIKSIYDFNDFSTSNSRLVLWGYAKLTKLSTLSEGLIGYYPLNLHSLDYSGNENHGEVNAHPYYDWGIDGKSIVLDGEDYVNLGSSLKLNPSEKMSISTWIYVDEWKDNSPIVERYKPTNGKRAYFMRLENDGKLKFTVYNDDESKSTIMTNENSINPGRWYHIVGTYHSFNGAKLYIDGVEVGSDNAVGPIQQVDTDTTIAGVMNSNSKYFEGKIDEVRFYQKILTPFEIKRLFDEPSEIY